MKRRRTTLAIVVRGRWPWVVGMVAATGRAIVVRLAGTAGVVWLLLIVPVVR